MTKQDGKATSRYWKYRYLIALFAVVIAFFMRTLIESVVAQPFPYFFSFTAVAIAAWIGGLAPGLLATALSAVLATGEFTDGEWLWRTNTSERVIGWIAFIVQGLIMSLVFESLHNSKRRLAAAVAESELSRQVAEESSQAKKEFIANLSHDVRTPLMAILGYTDLILRSDLPESERQKFGPKIQANIQALGLLVDDVLEISALEKGGIQFDRKTFPLQSFLNSLTRDLVPLAEQKGIRLEFRTKGFLPLEIESDQIKLHQMLVHVIGSAIRQTQGESVTVTATLRRKKPTPVTAVPGASLAFIIRSDGYWSEAALRPLQSTQRIFDVDEVLKTMKDNAPLERGFPLARRLAVALGGDIQWIRSGRGRMILVTLPIPIAPDFEDTVQEVILKSMPVRPPSVTQESPLAGAKVLLVEDSPDNRFLVSRFLDMAGAQVDTASNGQEGVDKASQGDYDVVVMDIQMPILDGNHAAQTLREKNFHRPLIALSAHAMQEDRKTALSAGFDDYIVKPVNRDDLVEKVSRYAFAEDGG